MSSQIEPSMEWSAEFVVVETKSASTPTTRETNENKNNNQRMTDSYPRALARMKSAAVVPRSWL